MNTSEVTGLHYSYIETPLGKLRLVADGQSLCRIEFAEQHGGDGVFASSPILEDCARQLDEYFEGRRQLFSLATAAAGTAFQHRIWDALSAIPYGELRSYRDIAVVTGNPKAVRAVGAANGKNPLPIVVPCHRVIGSNGSLTGFAGGLPLKRALLALEGIMLPIQGQLC